MTSKTDFRTAVERRVGTEEDLSVTQQLDIMADVIFEYVGKLRDRGAIDYNWYYETLNQTFMRCGINNLLAQAIIDEDKFNVAWVTIRLTGKLPEYAEDTQPTPATANGPND